MIKNKLAIELNDITYSHHKAKIEILQGFSIRFVEGEITGIFGPNGVGKSTLISLLNQQLKLSNGTIKCIYNIQKEGFTVTQQYRDSLLPWLSIKNNILLPLIVNSESEETRVKRLSEIQSLWWPSGLDLKKKPNQLSGGFQQLVSVFQCLVYRPRIIFMDEPFSALDYEFTKKVIELVYKFSQKYRPTIILVSHKPVVLSYLCSRVIILNKTNHKTVIDSEYTNSKTGKINYDVQKIITSWANPKD